MVSVGTILLSACLRASSVIIFLETWRDRLPLIVAIPDFSRSSDTSLSTTSSPASAATCAIPLPIWPEPITPTFLIIAAILSSHRGDARPAPAPSSLHKHRREPPPLSQHRSFPCFPRSAASSGTSWYSTPP